MREAAVAYLIFFPDKFAAVDTEIAGFRES